MSIHERARIQAIRTFQYKGKMCFYIASGLQNKELVKQYKELLESKGHKITYDWTTHGWVMGETDEVKKETCVNEKNGVLYADAVLMLLPGFSGTHTELGIALGQGIPVHIIGLLYQRNDCVFYWDELVKWHESFEEFLECFEE